MCPVTMKETGTNISSSLSIPNTHIHNFIKGNENKTKCFWFTFSKLGNFLNVELLFQIQFWNSMLHDWQKDERHSRVGTEWESPRLSRFFVRFFRRYYYEKKCGVSRAERGVGAWRGFPVWLKREVGGGAVTSRSHNRPCRSVMAAVYQERVLAFFTWTLLDVWGTLTSLDSNALFLLYFLHNYYTCYRI